MASSKQLVPCPTNYHNFSLISHIKKTSKDGQNFEIRFHKQTTSTLKQTADLCCNKIKEIPCISCPHKPQGAMTLMVKLNLFELKDIRGDINFCVRLAQEESVIILPGVTVGLKKWLRITFVADPSSLEDALERVVILLKALK